MQLHQLQPTHKSKRGKRVGRGGKKGTYSGRGGKGQTARAGGKVAPIIRGLIKRYPKLKGYRQERSASLTSAVNLDRLEKKFSDGQEVNPQTLAQARIIRHIKSTLPQVKILGRGSISKKLTVTRCTVSASAKEAIEKAGGSVK